MHDQRYHGMPEQKPLVELHAILCPELQQFVNHGNMAPFYCTQKWFDGLLNFSPALKLK
jgi:hypothetical protein